MPRLGHGATIKLAALEEARARVSDAMADVPLGFAVAKPVDLTDFDFMFPKLQHHDDNLLPEARATRDALIELGRVMRDTAVGDHPAGDSPIPAAYTYLGQFIDHDVTLEATSAALDALLDPELKPLPLKEIRKHLRNARTATLDLDSVYAAPAPQDGDRMVVGRVTPLGGTAKPLLRPPGKDDFNDLPREPRSPDITHDRAALTGDPRNDENTIIGQLHTAFLRAHNRLVDAGYGMDDARRLLRQHYQWMVLHDFLPRICDPHVVKRVLKDGNRFFRPKKYQFFIPLEFTVAAYRFGHSMVRQSYNFNLNFNRSGEPGTTPATLQLLFTFTALSGQLGFGAGTDTLPDNWIAEWENLVDVGGPFDFARRIDTQLVEPLFALRREDGSPEPGDGGRLAVRNLLRGYLLRIPTGQAVARAMDEKPLTAAQIEAAVPADQAQVLRSAGFLERTPLWFYVLAEAAHHAGGRHLGPVGSTIVVEVLAEMARRSEDSILEAPEWQPTLGQTAGQFDLPDLLRLGGVLPGGAAIPFQEIGVAAEHS
ncbi:MAG TPA: heme peroxidase family protein [Longimicrobium sp.]|nr:heme peroxidase family protein [Longimicrobium sp.]